MSYLPESKQTDGLLTGTNYPDSKNKQAFEQGLEFQDFVMDYLLKNLGIVVQLYSSRINQYRRGESIQGFEIKLDNRCTEFGRLSIEVAEKTRAKQAGWIPSGIMRGDNTVFYIQGNKTKFYMFAKKHLVQFFNRNAPGVDEKLTIKTFYLPFDLADCLCVCKFDTTQAK